MALNGAHVPEISSSNCSTAEPENSSAGRSPASTATASIRTWPGRIHTLDTDVYGSIHTPLCEQRTSIGDSYTPKPSSDVFNSPNLERVRQWPGAKSHGSEAERSSLVRQPPDDEVRFDKTPGEEFSHSSPARVRQSLDLPEGTGIDDDNSGRQHCYHCQGRLLLNNIYRCCHCPIESCDGCSINASLIHPGHEFRATNHTSENAGEALDPPSKSDLGITTCHTCQCELADVWYEYENRFDLFYSCADCRQGHIPGYEFGVVRQKKKSAAPAAHKDGPADVNGALASGAVSDEMVDIDQVDDEDVHSKRRSCWSRSLQPHAAMPQIAKASSLINHLL